MIACAESLPASLERKGPNGVEGPEPENRPTSLFSEIARAIVAALHPAELAHVTVTKTKELLEAEGASLLLLDDSTGELTFEAISGGAEAQLIPVRLAPGQGVAGWVAQNGQPVLVANPARDPRFCRDLDAANGFGTRSLVAVPLVIDARVAGVLEAVNPLDGESFEAADLQTLEELAPLVAAAVKNSRVTAALESSREEIRRNNTDLEEKVRQRTDLLSRGKREWELTFDAIGDPLFLVANFRVVRANLALARAANRPILEVIGRPCHSLLAGRDTPCPGCPLVTGRPVAELQVCSRPTIVSVFPVGDTGSTVVHYQDLTQVRQLEDHLRESQRLATVGQLAAGVAHEINNPLGSIVSNLHTLEGYLADIGRAILGSTEPTATSEVWEALGDAPEIVRETRDAAQRVSRIVRALKELAQGSSGQSTLEDLWTIVERAQCRAQVPDSRLLVTSRAPAQVKVDPLQLEIALANIMRNAVQASPRKASIRVGIELDGDFAVVSVEDAGPGMAPEVRARAFDPFFTTRPIGEGVGLGLTTAYSIVGRHGGTIAIDSEPGCGTTVRVRLPTAQ